MLLFSSIKGVFFCILEQIRSVAGAQQGLRASCADRAGTGAGVERDSLGSAGIISRGAGTGGKAAAAKQEMIRPRKQLGPISSGALRACEQV